MQTNTCLNTDTATRLLLGKLPLEQAEAIEEHLLDCNDCLELAQSIDVEDELLWSLKATSPLDSTSSKLETANSISGLVDDLEALGGAAQLASSAGEEIKRMLRPAQQEREIGRLLHFRVVDVRGAGGMGIVFQAEDDELRRTIALKAMRPSLAVDPEAKARFRREAMAIAAFEHDHIVTIYQVEEDNGIPFFTMPLLTGETLRERLRRDGKLPPDESIRITREIAQGLAAAHQRGLLHRDIKPDNIWLETPDDRVKILDFGLVRSVEDRSSLTHSGTILGTPEYMAPEQACGEDVDERCDLFSVGCVLYHMLTGQPPFRGKNVVATLVAISNANVIPPTDLDPAIPSDVSQLTGKLLQREPESRLDSANELISELDRCESISSTSPIRKPATTKQPPTVWKWLAIGLLAAGTFAGIVSWQTNYGTLHIDAAENVETKIKGDTVQILDAQSKKKLTLSVGENKLRPGEYEILVADDSAKLEFSTREFTIRRNGEKQIRVWLTQDGQDSPSELASSATSEETLREKLQSELDGMKLPITPALSPADVDEMLTLREKLQRDLNNLEELPKTPQPWHHGVSENEFRFEANEKTTALSQTEIRRKKLAAARAKLRDDLRKHEVQLRAVAMVVLSDDNPNDNEALLLPIDRYSVLLPPEHFTPKLAQGYLRIDVAKTFPRGPIGVKWGDWRVADAAKIAALLQADWHELKDVLYQIELLNKEDESGSPEFVIRSRAEASEPPSVSVRWGRAPGKELENERTPDAKLRRLKKWVGELRENFNNTVHELDVR